MMRCLVFALVMFGYGAEKEHAIQVISGEGWQGLHESQISLVKSAPDRAVLQTGTLPIANECLK
jgi:hypothetical protein